MFSGVWKFMHNRKPGGTRKVTITLDCRAFSFCGVNKKEWNAEPGAFSLLIGSSSAAIQLRGTFTLAH